MNSKKSAKLYTRYKHTVWMETEISSVGSKMHYFWVVSLKGIESYLRLGFGQRWTSVRRRWTLFGKGGGGMENFSFYLLPKDAGRYRKQSDQMQQVNATTDALLPNLTKNY